MRLILLVIALSGLSLTSHAESRLEGVSASRAPDESWQDAARREQRRRGITVDPRSPYARAESGDEAMARAQKALPDWGSDERVQREFIAVRDTRALRPGGDFPRRAPWLYPDDGCFLRAQVGAQLARGTDATQVPGKLYVFGKLALTTPYGLNGGVTWWYHVVAAVRVGGEARVLDPGIEPKRPLKLREWMERMSDAPEALRVQACAASAYDAYSPCVESTFELAKRRAEADQERFLDSEWLRLSNLGLDPGALLGSEPPWAQFFTTMWNAFESAE